MSYTIDASVFVAAARPAETDHAPASNSWSRSNRDSYPSLVLHFYWPNVQPQLSELLRTKPWQNK